MPTKLLFRSLILGAFILAIYVFLAHTDLRSIHSGASRLADRPPLERIPYLDPLHTSSPETTPTLKPESSSIEPVSPSPHNNTSQQTPTQSTLGPYTSSLIIVHQKADDVSWAWQNLKEEANLSLIHYAVDDEYAPYKIPKNKGHEVMPYLSYIINRYNELPDVSIFVHGHQKTWHNNDFLDQDMVLMVRRLSAPKVIRDGYFNLRCHLDPGCPSHLHPSLDEKNSTSDPARPEEIHVARAWRELFPGEAVPDVLSQPCCAQFALSRDRLRSVPRETYIRMRTWLENTPLEDGVAGRVWEYVWQYLWTREYEVCPEEHICYCDGYGVCFGGKGEYEKWFAMRTELRDLDVKVHSLEVEDGIKVGGRPKVDKETEEAWRSRQMRLRDVMEMQKRRALVRGLEAENRAAECERVWKEGDGF